MLSLTPASVTVASCLPPNLCRCRELARDLLKGGDVPRGQRSTQIVEMVLRDENSEPAIAVECT